MTNLLRMNAARSGVLVFIVLLALAPGLYFGFEHAVSLFLIGIAAMAPIALGAAGEVIVERCGMFNIGIEGMMLVSALFSTWVATVSGSWGWAIIAGGVSGGLLGLAFGVLATRGRFNQLLLGLGLNTAAVGLVTFVLFFGFGTLGFYRIPPNLRMPKVMTQYGPLSYMSCLAVVLSVGVYFILAQTRFGLRAKGVGFNPFVTDTLGIDVYRLRTVAAAVGGMFAGLAGTYLSLDWVGLISPTLVQGRGFIALACVKFGGLDPILTLEGALLFGLLSSMSLWMQNLPGTAVLMRQGGSYLFLMLPYLAVLVILVAFRQQTQLAKGIGTPYRRA